MDEGQMLELDRVVQRAAPLVRRWSRSLAQGNALDDDPFVLSPSLSRNTFLELRERPDSDPLKAPLSRWLVRLLDDKANRAVKVALAFERVVRTHPLDAPERGEFTLSALLKAALAEPERREAWLEQFQAHTGDARDAVLLYWERRREMAHRLELGSLDPFELPLADVAEDAERFLATTDDLASEFRASDLGRVLGHGLGIEAASGWPGRITPRALLEPFREAKLLEHLDLDPGRLISPVAPASHLRAFARVGAAFVDAAAAKNQPFSVAHDAFGLRRRTLGALFAGLPLSREFAKRELDVSNRFGDHQRALARVVLLAARGAAFRVLLREPLATGKKAFLEAYTGLGERVFGVPLPPEIAGVLYMLRPDDGQRFAGILQAFVLNETLIESHDDDWYRNPRAGDQLRSEAALVPQVEISTETLRSGTRLLHQTLGRALG